MATDKRRSKLVFRDLDSSTETGPLTIYALDAAGKVVSTAPVSEKGDFDLTPDAVTKAARVVIARTPEGSDAPDLKNAVAFHPSEIAERLRGREAIELGPSHAGILFPIYRCADGSVRHCWPYLLALKSLQADLTKSAKFRAGAAASITESLRPSANAVFDIAKLTPTILPRCRPVCDGVVEVWRRFCCCSPWVYLDSRFELLRDRLREIVVQIPKWRGPIPEPDPSPLVEAIEASGTVNPVLTSAAADLDALSTLQPAEQLVYVNARPYLHYLICSCNAPQKVAQGYIRPDGTFRICFPTPGYLAFPCYFQYSFVVKQTINGQVVTIYNGVAANNWTSDLTGVDLVSYHPRAINCRQDDDPVDGDAVYLQDIGLTPAWKLGKPAGGINPAGPYAPIFTHGLINPGGVGGSPANRNLGGSLRLRYFISNNIVSIAKFFRIGYVAAGSLGATPTYLPAETWLYQSGFDVIPYPLNTLRPDMSEIPFPELIGGKPWQSGQYHGTFNTNGLTEGLYVLILELFDAAGNPVSAGVQFANWNVPDHVDPAPFNKLLTPVYIDNRGCYGDIIDVTAPASTGSDPDCLYLSGPASQNVAIRYVAGFPDPNFLWYYTLWTHRGLSGPNVTLITSSVNTPLPDTNVTSTIGAMLGDHVRCAFAANLDVYAKTTDGIYDLTAHMPDQIAFSLEQTP